MALTRQSIRKNPLPLVPCANPNCRQLFNSRPIRQRNGTIHWTQHCSWDCSQITVHAKTRGKPLTLALAGKARKAAQRRQDRLRATFGELTPREQALIAWVERWAWNQGYLTGRRFSRDRIAS